MMKQRLTTLLGIVGIAAGLLSVSSLVTGADNGGLVGYGERTYFDKCASCHGADARGNGPVAEWLTLKPTNLRRLAKDNEGKYPFGHVYAVIEGRTAASGEGVHGNVRTHGSRSMPIWGKHFSDDATFGGASTADVQEVVHGRILGVVYYLQTLQEE